MIVHIAPDIVSAEVIAALLREYNIEVWRFPKDPYAAWSLGSGIALGVAEEDYRRARWHLDSSELTETELVFLATGEFRGPVTEEAELSESRGRVGFRRGVTALVAALACGVASIPVAMAPWWVPVTLLALFGASRSVRSHRISTEARTDNA